MQIILFGGAFDPIHLGHQQVTQALLKQKIAEEVWYIPTGVHDFAKQMTEAHHREAMLKLVLVKNARVENCELNRPGVSLTYQTLAQLSAQYPQHQFSWVIGSDNLKDFHKWHQWQEMLKTYIFYVYPRENYSLEPLYPGMVPLTKLPKVSVSSTEIRKRLQNQEKITNLVDPKIEQYIIKHKLYQLA